MPGPRVAQNLQFNAPPPRDCQGRQANAPPPSSPGGDGGAQVEFTDA